MNKWIQTGRVFYAVALAGMAGQQFFYPGFRPVFLPSVPPAFVSGFPVALFSVLLLTAAGMILRDYRVRKAGIGLALILLLCGLGSHLPYVLGRYPAHLGSWTDALKCLALAGGALVVAGSDPEPAHRRSRSWLEALIPMGRIFFSTTMVLFGMDHFLYAPFVATLVPQWIPGSLFWTYAAGCGLIIAGAAIILRIRPRLNAFLLGGMIFIWFLILHIPRAAADPFTGNGNEVTSVFQALGFSGIALLLTAVPLHSEVYGRKRWKKKEPAPRWAALEESL